MAAHTGVLGQRTRSSLEALIKEANLGEIDSYIARRYLIGHVPHIEIAAELQERYGCHIDRSTVSRHWVKCKKQLNNIKSPTE